MLQLSGNNLTIDGHAHVNGPMTLSGNNNEFTKRLEVAGNFRNDGNHNEIAQLVRNASYINMPDFALEDYQRQATKTYRSSQTFSGNRNEINGVVFVDGDVTITGNKFNGEGTIVATGSIYINGNNLEYENKEDFIGFYALQNIHFTGNNARIEGLFYAPQGEIYYHGNNATIYGALIANHIQFNGNNLHLEFDSRVADVDTEKEIRLVR